MFRIGLFLGILLFTRISFAENLSADSVFDVDLENNLLTFSTAKIDNLPLTDKRYYDYGWNIGTVFKADATADIKSYGNLTKRIIGKDENFYIEALSLLPKEAWPYVGPMLHGNIGVPERITNMPGIKETKNRFPKIIAKELQDIEDIEWLSPELYLLLMPQMWPSYGRADDKPQTTKNIRVAKKAYDFDTKFAYADKLKALMAGEQTPQGIDVSRLRTMNVTKTSPLTAADVRAFADTLSAVNQWGADSYLQADLMLAGNLLSVIDEQNGVSPMTSAMKRLVNPCQEIIRRVYFLEKDLDFYVMVSKYGFNPKSWAYTCDKTIKALRVSRAALPQVKQIVAYREGHYKTYFSLLKPKYQQMTEMNMDVVSQMHKASVNDVKEVIKNRPQLEKELVNGNNMILINPAN